jgi:hypothetical protein
VHDVRAAAGAGRLREQGLDRAHLGAVRPRGHEVRIPRTVRRRAERRLVLGVRDQQSVEVGDRPHGRGETVLVQGWEFVHAGRQQEAFEADDAGIVQGP